MRFVSVRVQGLKRFGDPTTLRVRGKTLALLGHNESGKTSLLEALAHLGKNGFAGATEFTDRRPRLPDDVVLSARFEVEEDDVGAVTNALEHRAYRGTFQAGAVWTMYKHANGKRLIDPIQNLTRDPAPRLLFAETLDRALTNEWTSLPVSAYDDRRQAQVAGTMTSTQESLAARSDEKRLPDDVLSRLAALKVELDTWAEAASEPNSLLDELRTDLTALDADERDVSPGLAAGQVLFSRMPAFVLFDDEARHLSSFTSFSEVPSEGLMNLLTAGGITFEELASLAGREGGREALVEEERQINLRLEQLFADWSQRDVTPAIKVDTTGVEIVGRDRSAPIIDPPLSQRSAGMRTFAALVAFLHAKSDKWSSRPVLLVDEAELHLHYDAQADLVRIFDRQDIAQCVVYTTHSIGCLPEDLGLGLVVVEESGEERSRVSQSFWAGGPGLTPIVLALGATAFSFTPARRVMIGEGAHEAILLPTLLRQARDGLPPHLPLGFQIVGGLSEISKQAAARLDEEAGTVVYVVDNDAGGRAAAAVLPKHVRDSDRVFTLGDGTNATCIEDFVSATTLVVGIDEVLRADGRTPLELDPSEVPPSGRAKWAVDRLAQAGSQDARTRLAQAVVIAGSETERGLVEPGRVDALRELLTSVQATMPLPHPS
jgi:energy-coupling factor transporter ATP-binding protein EcfA2